MKESTQTYRSRKNTPPNKNWFKEKNQEGKFRSPKFNQNGNTVPISVGPSKGSPKRKFDNTSKIPEISQISNLMIHLKALEKQEQTKPQRTKWGEIIKIKDKKIVK